MIQEYWGKFEDWVHGWAPGFKTRITTGLGALSSIAASVQGYFSGLPLSEYISAHTLAITSAVLFSLSYWFRGMGDRVEAREEEVKTKKKKAKKSK